MSRTRARTMAEYNEAVEIIIWLREKGIIAQREGDITSAQKLAMMSNQLEKMFLLPEKR